MTVIQNADGEDLGLLARHFPGARVVRAFAGERVPDEPGDALIVLGGPQNAYDPTRWMADAMRLVRRAHESGIPTLGICLGAQLVAHALGGRAVPGHAPEAGFAPLRVHAADPLLADLDGESPVFHLHNDTYVPPPGAVRLASSALYEEQAFRLGATTWGIQFHVEWAAEDVARFAPAFAAEARRREPEMRALAAGIGKRFASVLP